LPTAPRWCHDLGRELSPILRHTFASAPLCGPCLAWLRLPRLRQCRREGELKRRLGRRPRSATSSRASPTSQSRRQGGAARCQQRHSTTRCAPRPDTRLGARHRPMLVPESRARRQQRRALSLESCPAGHRSQQPARGCPQLRGHRLHRPQGQPRSVILGVQAQRGRRGGLRGECGRGPPAHFWSHHPEAFWSRAGVRGARRAWRSIRSFSRRKRELQAREPRSTWVSSATRRRHRLRSRGLSPSVTQKFVFWGRSSARFLALY
jgi:hypothetical protein